MWDIHHYFYWKPFTGNIFWGSHGWVSQLFPLYLFPMSHCLEERLKWKHSTQLKSIWLLSRNRHLQGFWPAPRWWRWPCLIQLDPTTIGTMDQMASLCCHLFLWYDLSNMCRFKPSWTAVLAMILYFLSSASYVILNMLDCLKCINKWTT